MKKYLMIIIFITSIFCSLFLGGKLFFLGKQSEREKILYATVWKLSKDGYKENEIKKIKVSYDPLKGGVLPYQVFIVFKKDTSKTKIYSWSSVEEKQIVDAGISAGF
ncbi:MULTISPECIES: DUF3139 domain-containing protein [Clostridium]|uniref:DUF3139 domain-containing protein n=1 Tax=Clostridium frigoriphilum TaxID=443253 RepID=A0ABU7UVF2_9CLOT|nr:DUF3139 domain-containing protein [Clostridium sp. DSM 17811]MBU3100817.1 DUF3139 domain-containing protein [Clostridium sp. DSM 17811]